MRLRLENPIIRVASSVSQIRFETGLAYVSNVCSNAASGFSQEVVSVRCADSVIRRADEGSRQKKALRRRGRDLQRAIGEEIPSLIILL